MKKVISLILLVLGLIMGCGLVFGELFISEVMYDPTTQGSDTDLEWIEIYNSGPGTVNLTDWLIDDKDFNDTNISSGEYLIVARTLIDSSGSFESYYGNNDSVWNATDASYNAVDGSFTLVNTPANALVNLTNGTTEILFNYSSYAGDIAINNGKTLERYNFISNNWAESQNINGTPGAQNSVYDDVYPSIDDVTGSTTGYTGDLLTLYLNTSDNVNVTKANITVNSVEYSMNEYEDDKFSYDVNVPTEDLTTIKYNITIWDAAGFNNLSGNYFISVEDNDKPTYTWNVKPEAGTTGESVIVNITGADNIGVITANITKDGSVYEMTKVGNDFNFTIDVPSGSKTSIVYNVTLFDAADNSNTTGPVTITVSDNDKPTYSNLVESHSDPATYSPGQVYEFNVTWQDNVALDEVEIEFGGTNYSLSDAGNGIYNFTISDLTAGIYYYYFWANDTSGNINATEILNYTVNKADSTCSLIFDQTSPKTYGTAINASCSCTNPEASVVLWRGGVDVTVNENNKLFKFSAGVSNYICNISETQNYTSATNSTSFTIDKATSQVSLLINGTDGNITIELGDIVNETGILVIGQGTIELYENGALAKSGVSPLTNLTQYKDLGVFNVTVDYSETENYSSSSETHWIIVKDKTPPSWTTAPTDDGAELGLSYTQSVLADDLQTITYSVNDTSYYDIDSSTGEITNSTSVPIGVYNLDVIATDASSNPLNKEIVITVSDTTAPTWTTEPFDDGVKLGVAYIQSVLASDLQTITYSVNDSSFYDIDSSTGEITNSTYVPVGVCNLNITAIDASSNSLSKEITITVNDTTAPVVNITNPLADVEVNEDEDITFTDDDLTNAECSIDNSNWVECINGTTTLGDLTGFDALPEGAFTLYLRDTDAFGNVGEDNESGIIKDSIAPQITIISPIEQEYFTDEVLLKVTANEESWCWYNLNSEDPEDEEILFEDDLQGNITLIADEYENTITIYCEDYPGNVNDTESVTFTVNTNTAPDFDFYLEDQSAAEDELFSYQINATDEDEDGLSFSENMTQQGFEIDNATGLITWTPNNTDVGLHNVLITLCDNQSRSNSCVNDSFAITVNNTNDVPVIHGLENQDVVQGSLLNFTINASDVDVGDVLSYFDNVSFGSLDESIGKFLWTPNNTDIGTHNVLFEVCDNSSASNNCTTQGIVVGVSDLNEDPILSAIANQPVDEDSQLSFIIYANDSDLIHNDILTYSSNVTGSLGLSITKASNQTQAAVTWTPDNDDVGTHNVEFMVKDKLGLNDTKTMQITVINTNDAPTLNLSQQPIQEGEIKTFDLNLYTTDIDPVVSVFTYNVTEQDLTKVNCTLDDVNNNILTIQAISQQGVMTNCRIEVSDTTNSTIYTLYVIIQSVDNPPVFIGNIPDVSMTEDTSKVLSESDLDNYFSDPDSAITYSASSVNNLSISISSAGIVTITPEHNFFGVRTVKFIAASNSQQAESNDVTVTVNGMSDNPEIISYSPSTTEFVIAEDGVQEFSITAIDPDNEALTTRWYVDNVFNASGQIFTFNANLFGAGTYGIKAKVNDSGMHFKEQSWTLTVSEVPVTDDYEMDYNVSAGITLAKNVSIESKTTAAKIDFGAQAIDLSNVVDIDNNVRIQDNLVGINTGILTALNRSATITMVALGLTTPIIYYDNGLVTNKDNINKVCSFCDVVSYEQSTGILMFNVDHFTSFTAKDQSTAYSMSLSPNEIVFGSERGTEQIKEFLIKNTGSQTLEDVKLTLIPETGKNISMKLESGTYTTLIPKFNLAAGGSQKILVKTFVSDREKTTKAKIGKINISTKDLGSRTMTIYQQPPTKLKITSVEIDDGEDEYFVSNNGRVDDVKPDSKLQFMVEVENLYTDGDNEDHEIRSIEIDIRIKKILKDGKKDMHDDTKSFRLDPTEVEEETLDFSIPLKINEKSSGYKVEIIAEGKDKLGAKHEDRWDLTLYIEKEDHDIRITRAELENSELGCDKSTYLDVKIQNYGSEDEKDVVLEVKNSELGIDEKYTAIPKLQCDVFDDDSYFSRSFYIEVPENAAAKKYPISVIVYYDDDEEIDEETVYLDVKDCEIVKEIEEKQTEEAKILEEIEQGVQAQVYQQYQPKEIEQFRLSDSLKTTLMICGFIILLGLVIFLFMALFMTAKKKRKY